MKTSLCLLLLTLATAANAAPLSPGMSMAIGAGVAATNQSFAPSSPRIIVPAPSLHPVIALPVSPRIGCILPVPVQAARPAAPRPQVSR
jgi:hypothetical protein